MPQKCKLIYQRVRVAPRESRMNPRTASDPDFATGEAGLWNFDHAATEIHKALSDARK